MTTSCGRQGCAPRSSPFCRLWPSPAGSRSVQKPGATESLDRGDFDYYPAKTATVRDGLSFWRVYPYVERKGDGSAYFHLRLSLYPPMDDSWSMADARFTADGGGELPVDTRHLKVTTNWPIGWASYEFDGPEVEDLVRRLASAQEAWLVVFGTGDPTRTNLRLKAEHLAAFREIVAQYDSLQAAGEP